MDNVPTVMLISLNYVTKYYGRKYRMQLERFSACVKTTYIVLISKSVSS